MAPSLLLELGSLLTMSEMYWLNACLHVHALCVFLLRRRNRSQSRFLLEIHAFLCALDFCLVILLVWVLNHDLLHLTVDILEGI